MSYAGVLARFAAAMIDSLIFVGFILLMFVVVFDDSLSSYEVVFTITFFIQWIYFAFMESRFGATFGKKLLGLTVVDLDGNTISFARASGRYFAKFLSGILCIGYIMAFFTEKKQALHDMLAGTLVVDRWSPRVSNEGDPPLTPEDQPEPLSVDQIPDITPVDFTTDSFGTPENLPPAHDVFTPPPPPKPPEPTKKPVAIPPGAKACHSCGNVVGLYQKKCHKCGAKLKKGLL